MVSWALWSERNKTQASSKTQALEDIHKWAIDLWTEYKDANNPTSTTRPPRPPTSWNAPSVGHYKENFDGAIFPESNSAGIGVIIQDS